jgi:trehalose/maltose hydrolase-like predicted phosphorylase
MLSDLVHAWVLARAHHDDAHGRFARALRGDVTDVQGGTTAEGVHLAAMAGTIDLVQRCFAGVDSRDGVLQLDPCWPAPLGAAEFGIRCHDHMVTVAIADQAITVSSGPGSFPPVRVGCRGEVRELACGQTLTFAL